MISILIKRYNEGGINALQNKHKPGNPLAKYLNRKQLSEIEQWEYVIKNREWTIKKGYTEKDVLLALEKLSEKNTK